jgi:hypothetical protein
MDQTIKLDTRKRVSEVQIAPLRRGERNNALLTVRICANGQPYDLTGKTASLVATTAAGKLVGPYPMEVAEAGAARIMLPAALYSAVGVFSGYVEIRDGEALVDTTDRFGGKVLECADLDAEQAAEFTPVLRDMEQAVADAKRATIEANEAASHQPRIGKSDTWEVWDITTDQYVDTGVAARGTQGIQGEPGPKGDQGPTGAKGDPGEPGSDAAATDVRIAGKSITADGVADIPAAVNNGSYGVVKVGAPERGGIQINANGNISNIAATNAQIDAHAGWFQPIVPSNLDYAVKAAMCDGKGAAWTAAEQAAARERMGLGNSLELIEAWELDHDETMVFRRDTTPSGEPYRFKELRVVVRHANGSGMTNVSVGAHSAQGIRSVTICFLPAPGSGDRSAAISASAVFGTINSLAVTNVGSTYLQGQVVSTPDSVGIPLMKESDAAPNFDYISSFRMSNAMFKAGCKVLIYGVWA